MLSSPPPLPPSITTCVAPSVQDRATHAVVGCLTQRTSTLYSPARFPAAYHFQHSPHTTHLLCPHSLSPRKRFPSHIGCFASMPTLTFSKARNRDGNLSFPYVKPSSGLPTAVGNVVLAQVQRCPRPSATLSSAEDNEQQAFLQRDYAFSKEPNV